MDLKSLAARIPYSDRLDVRIGSYTISFDMSQKHERLYALREILGWRHPQADIDRALFHAFVRPGDVCIDMGANIGVTAVEMLLAGAAKIVAFEPVADLARRLQRLQVDEIECHPLALSNKTGVVQMMLSQTHNQGHSLDPGMAGIFPTIFGEMTRSERVVSTTVDDFFSDNAGDIWKIDVEGVENDVLVGAQRILRSAPPRIIFCESYYDPARLRDALGDAWSAARAVLRKSDYQLALLPVANALDEAIYHHTSPMYVFYRPGVNGLPVGLPNAIVTAWSSSD